MRIDIGCGKNKRGDEWIGVDIAKYDCVNVVHDIRIAPWPFADDSVEEVYCSHVLEHLTNFDDKWERVRFFNELQRVMKKGAKATIIVPHWNSCRFYGDPTHKEAWSEMGFYYLNKAWRDSNAPHTDSTNVPWGYLCDFDATWGYSLHPSLNVRNVEYQQFALNAHKEAAQDIVATLTKR